MTGEAVQPDSASLAPSLSVPLLPRQRETVGHLQAHLGVHPQNAEAWFQLGAALSAAGRFEEATAALESALTLSQVKQIHQSPGGVRGVL